MVKLLNKLANPFGLEVIKGDIANTEVRPIVSVFAKEMEIQLSVNDNKGGWRGAHGLTRSELVRLVGWYAYKLQQKLEVVYKQSYSTPYLGDEDKEFAVRKAAADLANFAMFAADNLGGLWPFLKPQLDDNGRYIKND